MAENKKQHYIPQFFLRNFSEKTGKLWIYILESEKSISSPIKSTCQGSYFYGKDLDYEKALSTIEQKQSTIISKIIKKESIIDLSLDEYRHLYSFMLLQSARTKEARIHIDNFVEFFSEAYFKPFLKESDQMKKYSNELIDSIEISMPELHMKNIATALRSVVGILDLQPLLLINKTNIPFISSDAPIIKNNYLKVKTNDLTGLQSPGLQILCPLNKKLVILLIHKDAYVIKKEINSIVELKKKSDVDCLNKLQILNSLEILFIIDDGNSDYIHDLHVESLKMRKMKEFVQEKIRTKSKKGGEEGEIDHIYSEGINYGIHFSFLKINHKYNRNFKRVCKKFLKENDYITPIRNEELNNRMESHFKKSFKEFIKKS